MAGLGGLVGGGVLVADCEAGADKTLGICARTINMSKKTILIKPVRFIRFPLLLMNIPFTLKQVVEKGNSGRQGQTIVSRIQFSYPLGDSSTGNKFMADDPIYHEIRRRITKRYANRAEFFSHLVSFVVVNLAIWSLLTNQLREWALLLPVQICAGLWLMGLLVHATQFLLVEMRERAIEKAIERERDWRTAMPYTPERDLSHLAEDGELQTDYYEMTPKRKRR